MGRKSVALLIETSNGYSRGLLEGVIAYTKERGHWSVHLTEQERGAPPPSWLQNWGGDGIIARIETDSIGRQLRKFRVPIVDLSAARHVKGVPWADTEDRAISQLAVDHFVERGFRHVAYCGDAGFAWSRKRAVHFCRQAQAADCTVHQFESVGRYDKSYDLAAEKRRIIEWLKELPRPIAIMGCYDFIAQQILDACRQLNISVPAEVAVLGVDNDRLICDLCEPTLSSVIPDTRRTGYEAADLLNRMMSGEHVATEEPLITQPLGVQLRESTDTLAIEDSEIAKALQYIRRHANANIRVGDVLRHLSLSRRALEHRFKKYLGHTPHEEIQRVRINRIKDLLRNTDLSIGQIADRTGFEYVEYMAAAFKRETGQTPTEYRG
ncbi:AraC family transcriptional regulator [Aporhodopirellula aestuarii]|uniref:DNA-binding transcriptional regulator n=1 Tax=Aporhodopirellula aestuarii TaxID=2950107 RepID=A0ABT0TXE4_9BACT|nr:DNA-binding transcriptional regulator [Aporhodopirellula aestuarii]MCM2369255.1 DNA-binding transcriptional regulator [Aporhodopirellula aestuarii]